MLIPAFVSESCGPKESCSRDLPTACMQSTCSEFNILFFNKFFLVLLSLLLKRHSCYSSFLYNRNDGNRNDRSVKTIIATPHRINHRTVVFGAKQLQSHLPHYTNCNKRHALILVILLAVMGRTVPVGTPCLAKLPGANIS